LDAPAVRIPIIWWLAMSISSGLNYVATSSFSCFEDIKGLDQQLRNLTIKDPVLRQEYMRFANECYLPAKAKYVRALRGGKYHDYVEASLTDFRTNFPEYDGTDPFFIGSHFYLTTEGFYHEFDRTSCSTDVSGCGIRAKDPVDGWPVVAARDNYSAADIAAATPGRPYCDEWWTDGVRGVKTKLLTSLEASNKSVEVPAGFATLFDWIKDAVVNAYTHIVLTDAQIEDLVISRYVRQDPPDFIGGLNSLTFTDTDFTGSAAGFLGSGVAGAAAAHVTRGVAAVSLPVVAVGGAKVAFDVAETFGGFYLTMFIAKSAAPMIQAVLLMVIYGLLLVYLVVGEYEVDNVLTALFLILTLRFFTPLWAIANYLDSQLFLAMYPDATILGSVLTFDMNRVLLDAVLTVLYLVAPLMLLFLMGMAGQKIGEIGRSMGGGNMLDPVRNTGNSLAKAPGKAGR
jgi:hypothetical protein